MILVTSANGNQGKLLLPKLARAGLAVRASVQSEASAAQALANGACDVVAGDISDPQVLARAIRGVEKVYHIGPSAHPRERDIGFAIVDAARAEGVRHFVMSSVLHAITTDLVQHEIKRDIEEHLLSSGLEFTILQPANYMVAVKFISAFTEGVFKLPWSLDRRQSMVALDDVTDIAAMVLIDGERHVGATYELAAEGRFTADDIAAVISGVVDRPVRVQQISAEDHLARLFGNVDLDEFSHQIKVVRSICARYSSHDFTGNPNVLTWLLGRRPTSLEQFIRSEYSAFTAAADKHPA